MYKALGALLVIGSFGYAGLRVGRVFRLRTDLLRNLQNGLNLLETEISFAATPLPIAMQRVGEKLSQESAIPFLHAARLLREAAGITADEAWEEGIRQLTRSIPLTKEELSILIVFGRSLGSSSKNEQIKNIALAREQLSMQEKQAWEARNKKERMWQYLGFCLGAVVVLVLM